MSVAGDNQRPNGAAPRESPGPCAPRIGLMPSGPRGTIADVAGVTVGHSTVARGDLQTGVTVVRPHPGDPFRDKVPAAAVVINGFGKSVGLIQVNELGVLETPIALTNTFAIGTVATAQVRAAIRDNPGIARSTTSVNPLVFECSDAYLSDMQAIGVDAANYDEALASAATMFARGAVGAGRGMSCFGLKGGIGTSSRRVDVAGRPLTLGAVVLANFGKLESLTIAGRRIGPALARRLAGSPAQQDRGSVIVVLATDAPLDHRQLRRIAMRAAAGIARTGSYYGHGSGDIALAFSTAATVPHEPREPVLARPSLAEPLLETLFDAAAEATEQAVLDAIFSAETVRGFGGRVRHALTEVAPDWAALPVANGPDPAGR
jgi:D-aminopeptidase